MPNTIINSNESLRVRADSLDATSFTRFYSNGEDITPFIVSSCASLGISRNDITDNFNCYITQKLSYKIADKIEKYIKGHNELPDDFIGIHINVDRIKNIYNIYINNYKVGEIKK